MTDTKEPIVAWWSCLFCGKPLIGGKLKVREQHWRDFHMKPKGE